MPKTPDIYCRKGRPLGSLSVNCETAFRAAADHAVQTYGAKGQRVHEAAEHLICGLELLTGQHGLDLAAAHKAAAQGVKDKHGLNAVALNEVVKLACAHWTRGSELRDLVLGRG